MNPNIGFCAVIALTGLRIGMSGNSPAQDYPAKTIRFVVPFPAGSGIDTMSRVMIEELRARTNAVIVIDHKPGALGQIGAEFTARAPADGYTVMISSSATHSSGPQLAKKVPYDALNEFTHIARLALFDLALMLNPAQGFKTPQDLVAQAKRFPDKLTFGYGSGTAQVTAASFNRSTGIQVRGIPYKGQPLALTDLLGGQINFVMADLAVIMSHVKSGRLMAASVASSRRSALLPSVPTLAELGIRDVELSGWVGVSGPANMLSEPVNWWSRNLNLALRDKVFLEKLHAIGVEGEPNSVEEFNTLVRDQYRIWGTRIREAGIEPQ